MTSGTKLTPLVFGQAGPPKAPSNATAYNIDIPASETPKHAKFGGSRQASAHKTSELLMLNHARFHTLFDYVGFHSEYSSSSIVARKTPRS